MGRLRISLLLLALLPFAAAVPIASAHHVPMSDIEWACGFGPTRPENCGIEGIDDPTFDDRPWLDADDRVIGVVVGTDARAYAIKQLDNHEIVNDNVGGMPLSITWCPLCGSAVAYQRIVEIDGGKKLLEFDVSGFLYKHDLVMYDAETDTLWTQIDGTPIASLPGSDPRPEHADAELEPYPSTLTTWAAWREAHPNTKLLDAVHRSYGGSYSGYDSSCRFGISGKSECNVTGLHPKEQVFAIEVDGVPQAYPVFAVLQVGGVVIDEVAGQRIVVAAEVGASLRAYAAGDRNFTRTDAGAWFDEDGDQWNLNEGRRTKDGFRLDTVDGLPLFWFAWQTHHPTTGLWLPEAGYDGKPPEATGFEAIPAPGLFVMIGLASLLLWVGRRVERS